MIAIAGYDFINPRRHVRLRRYNANSNKDKVAYIVSTAEKEIWLVHGRTGSKLRRELITTQASEFGVSAGFDKELRARIKQGYEVSEDVSYSTNGLARIDQKTEKLPEVLTLVWQPRDYAENPVRMKSITQGFSLDGYAVVVVPQGKFITTLIEGGKTKCFDQHGAGIPVPEELEKELKATAQGSGVVYGVWDGEVYYAFDMPSDEKVYTKRLEDLQKFIAEDEGFEGIGFAPVYDYATQSKHCMDRARFMSAQAIIGINLEADIRPGQNDNSYVIMSLRPRAIVRVLKQVGNTSTFGIDDGLGFIEVGFITSDKPLKVGDNIRVEYDSWSGHGFALTNPVYVETVSDHDCLIDQLLAV